MINTPYSIQAPEEIAKTYGGDKKKIAKAAQMGVVDSTAAVLAGMFIDRIRNAAVLEQAPTQTVADDVLARGMDTQVPQQEIQNDAGGIGALDVPEDMYDFSAGGIVAFQDGGEATSDRSRYAEYLKNMEKELDDRKKEDKWMSLTQFGLNLAGSDSPRFLQAVGQAGAQTLPAMQQAAASRRASEEAAIRGLAESEQNKQDYQLKVAELEGKTYRADESNRVKQAIADKAAQARIRSANINAAASKSATERRTDMINAANIYADAQEIAIKSGERPPTPRQVLLREGIRDYQENQGAAYIRAATGQDAASLRKAQFLAGINEKAEKLTQQQIFPGGSAYTEYNKLRAQDRENGTNTAQEYASNLTAANAQALLQTPESDKAPIDDTVRNAPPERAIIELKQNPSKKMIDFFNAKYGKGKAEAVLNNR